MTQPGTRSGIRCGAGMSIFTRMIKVRYNQDTIKIPKSFPHEESWDYNAGSDRRKWVLNHAKKNGLGAEFGAFRGHFAQRIMEVTDPRKLYLVDPWEKQGERFNWGGTDVPNPKAPYICFNKLTTREAKEDAVRRLQPFADRIEFCEAFEDDWCQRFQGRLDWVYLDSSHFYRDVLQTLVRLDKLLSPTGVIMGDDWHFTGMNTGTDQHYSGVCRAVNDFVRMFEYEIVIAGRDAQFVLRRTPAYSHPKQQDRRPGVEELTGA